MEQIHQNYRLLFHGSNQIRFRYPTHQLVICTEQALTYLSFKESSEVHE